MRHGSLFSGGGGFDLAAEAVGWENVFHCEKDAFCQTVLKHYWPTANSISDIKEFDGRPYRRKIDILTGGFPCQPFSTAGKRLGTADDRYLWPEMLRVIKQIKPRWIVGENVYGLVNWNEGMVFQQVLSDLEAEGYEVAPVILPAAGVNAPHQRYRVWIIGYNSKHTTQRKAEADPDTRRAGRVSARLSEQTSQRRNSGKRQHTKRLHSVELEKAYTHTNGNGRIRCHRTHEKLAGKTGQYAQRHLEPLGEHIANSDSKRQKSKTKVGELERWRSKFNDSGNHWESWPAQSPLCGGDDGLPSKLDGITFPKWKSQSIKMFGNAIVPQVAVQIFKAIQQFEQSVTS
jgi:DNA (cytosine-5)-methyltransferase 1